MQVHNILVSFLTHKVAKKLCEMVREVQNSTGAVDEEGGNLFRVRVVIDITSPLCKGQVITLSNAEKTWVNFKYERLPSLCYWCGHLNHDDRDCDLWMENNGTLSTEQ